MQRKCMATSVAGYTTNERFTKGGKPFIAGVIFPIPQAPPRPLFLQPALHSYFK